LGVGSQEAEALERAAQPQAVEQQEQLELVEQQVLEPLKAG